MTGVRGWILGLAGLVVLDVAFLSPALLTDRVRAPGDITPHWTAFVVDRPPPPPPLEHTMLQDWVVQFHPWHHRVREAWLAGHAPLWNDGTGGGEPLLANGQSEALSPYLPLLLFDADQYADLRQLAQILMAQIFMLLAARRLGLGPAGAVVAAAGYSFSSYMQLWAVHPHSASASFAPMFLYALLLLARRHSVARVAFASLALALAVLAGHVETAAKVGGAGALIATLVAMFDRQARHAWRFVILLPAVAALAALLAACQILPLLDYLGESGIREMRGQDIAQGVPAKALLTLLWPFIHGTPATYRGTPNYPDAVTHIGCAGLLLAAVAIAGLRRCWRVALPLAVAAAIPIVLACLPDAPWWHRVPLLGEVWRFRILFAATLPLALFAGVGADLACRSTRAPLAAAIVAATALAAAAPWFNLVPQVTTAEIHPPSRALDALRARSDAGRAMELGLVTPAGLPQLFGVPSIRRYDAIGFRRYADAFRSCGRRPDRHYSFMDMANGPPALLDAMSVRWVLAFYPASESRTIVAANWIAPGAELTLDIRDDFSELVAYRYDGPIDASVHVTLRTATGDVAHGPATPDSPPQPVIDCIETDLNPVGFHVIASAPHRDGVATVTVRCDAGSPGFGLVALARGGVGPDVRLAEDQGMLKISERTSALPLAYLAPRILGVAGPAEAAAAFCRPDHDPHALTVVEGLAGAPPGGPADGETCVITERRPGSFSVAVKATAPRLLVLTEAYSRGWIATVGGAAAAVMPANLVGLCCVVPAGEHLVRFDFLPPSFTWGCLASGVVAVLLLAASLRRRRTEAAPAPPTSA